MPLQSMSSNSSNVYVKTLSGDILSLVCEPTVFAVWYALNHYDSEQYPLHRTDVYPLPIDEVDTKLTPLFMVFVLPFSSIYFRKREEYNEKVEIGKSSMIVYSMDIIQSSFEQYETYETPESHRIQMNIRMLPESIHVVYHTNEDRSKSVFLNHTFRNYHTCCTEHSHDTLDDNLDNCAHQFTKKDDTSYRGYRLTEEAKTSIKRFIRMHQ